MEWLVYIMLAPALSIMPRYHLEVSCLTETNEEVGEEMTGPDPNSTLESEPNPVRDRHLAGAKHK
ncbi:unnamed protein product [Prunus armeniaca]